MIKKFLPKTDFKSYEDFKKNYRLNIPENFNFAYDIVDEWALTSPEKIALHWCDDHDNEKILTFTDLKRMSDKASNMFTDLGITKGDTVMLILKQRIEVWVSMLALHKIGAVVIPATFQLMPKDIDYRVNAGKIKMIVTVNEQELIDNIKEVLPKCPTLKNVLVVGEKVEGFLEYDKYYEKSKEEWRRVPNKVTDKMLIYFSSGTTGMPKMILHDFSYPLGHIVTAKYWQKVEDGGRHLTVADSGWAKFGWGKIYGQWICGAIVVGYDNEKFVPSKMLEMMQKLKLTTFCAPPTIYRFLIKEHLENYDLSTIKQCAIAGEPLNPEVYYKFKELTGLEVREGFGQSETSVLIANFGFDKVKPGSTGKPSPLYDIDIVDENGNSCEDGIVGTIVVNTNKLYPAGLFHGYYKDKEANDRAWKDGVYSTGDMAWRDSDGYFWFVGRNDDVIKCSGYRIGPFEVESAMLTHPSVLECAITAVPDPIRGQVVKATVVLTKQYKPSEELIRELQNHVKHTTAPYKYPRIIEFVEELPKTLSGKIKRGQIRNQDNPNK